MRCNDDTQSLSLSCPLLLLSLYISLMIRMMMFVTISSFSLVCFSSTEEELLDMSDVMSCLCFFEICLFCLHTLLPFLLLCFFLLRNESNDRKHFFTLNELVGEWTFNCFDNRQ